MSSLLYHNYLLPYLHIFIYSFLSLHFALEFVRCPYRTLQIQVKYVDVEKYMKAPGERYRFDITAPVVQKWITLWFIRWITQLVFLKLVRWIVIYPVDGSIQRLNNRGLVLILNPFFFWLFKLMSSVNCLPLRSWHAKIDRSICGYFCKISCSCDFCGSYCGCCLTKHIYFSLFFSFKWKDYILISVNCTQESGFTLTV